MRDPIGHDRYLCDPGAAASGRVTLTQEEFHHATRVRRLRVGDRLQLIDGRGRAYTGRVETIGRGELVAAIEGEAEVAPESSLDLTLVPAVLKGDRFEWILEKGTELGVRAFQPLVAERTQGSGRDHTGRLERWRRVVREATKQCGRGVVPEVAEPATLAATLAGVFSGGIVLLSAVATPSAPALGSVSGPPWGPLWLFCGPEGGFTEIEEAQILAAGAHSLRLGGRRLRAETAVIAGTAVLLSRCGELG